MDGRMDGRTDGRMDGWMDSIYRSTLARVLTDTGPTADRFATGS